MSTLPSPPPVPGLLCVILCTLSFLLGACFGVGLLFHEAAVRSSSPHSLPE
jgi:hypothetical protein